MIPLTFKRWYGIYGERHTAADWNRLVFNAETISGELIAPRALPPYTTEAGALTLSMAAAMDGCITDLSYAAGIDYEQGTLGDGDFVSFVDINRWEYGLWAVYRSLGGVGRPEDSATIETLKFPFSGWHDVGGGAYEQTVSSEIATAGMNAVVGLTQFQLEQISSWSILGPYVTTVGNGTVTVRLAGLEIGGKDLELTLIKVG